MKIQDRITVTMRHTAPGAQFDEATLRRVRSHLTRGFGDMWFRETRSYGSVFDGRGDIEPGAVAEKVTAVRGAVLAALGDELAAVVAVQVRGVRGDTYGPDRGTVGSPADIREVYSLG